MIENNLIHGTVLDAAHGNPSTLYALETIANSHGFDFASFPLTHSGSFADILHQIMTKYVSGAYTKHSTELRKSIVGKVFASYVFAEFYSCMIKALSHDSRNPFMLAVIQELILLGADVHLLQDVYGNNVNLYIPDVYPKKSAVLGIEQKKDLHANVILWNEPAQAEVAVAIGSRSKLYAPFLLRALSEEDTFNNIDQPEVVVKTSGSGGMTLQDGLLIKQLCDQAGISCFIHFPHSFISSTDVTFKTYDKSVSKKEIIKQFFAKLSIHTKVLICYPSEMVQVAAEVALLGVPVRMVCLPPRGAHEVVNLEFAIKSGLCIAMLNLSGKRIPSWGVRTISIQDLPDVIHLQIPNERKQQLKSLLGSIPVEESFEA